MVYLTNAQARAIDNQSGLLNGHDIINGREPRTVGCNIKQIGGGAVQVFFADADGKTTSSAIVGSDGTIG